MDPTVTGEAAVAEPRSYAPTDVQEGAALWHRLSELLVRHSFLILLLGLALATRLLWAAITPLWQTPDEISHFAYVQSLGEDLSLQPSEFISREVHESEVLTGLIYVPFHPETTQRFAPDSRDGPAESEVRDLPPELRAEGVNGRGNGAAGYPPGYYLIASAVYRATDWGGVITTMFTVRALSAVLSVVTIFFSYLTLQRIFEDQRSAQAAAVMLAVFPMYTYAGMSVNPDVMVWLLFSIFLYLSVKALDDGMTIWGNAGMAATMIAGLWVKQTFLIVVPIYCLLLGLLLMWRSLSPFDAAKYLASSMCGIAVLAGGLYLSGAILTSTEYPGGVSQERTIGGFIRHFDDYRNLFWRTFDSFWGMFGWLDTPLSKRVYDMLRFGTFVALVGAGFSLLAGAVRGQVDRKMLFMAAICVLYVSAYVVLNYLRITRGEAWLLQGRYFFMIIVPIVALLVRGILWYAPNARSRDAVLLAAVAASIVFHAEVMLRYVIPRFYL